MCLLRYPGGKQRAVTKILDRIPSDVTTLYSPFFGGGAVEIAWAQQNPAGRVIARDAFPELVNFWQHIAHGHGPAMADKIRRHYFPLEKDAFYLLQSQLRVGMGAPFDRACWFYTLNRASFSGATLSGGMGDGDRFTKRQLDKLAGYRLPPNIEIRKADSLDWLRRRTQKFSAPGAFIFADPPYLLKSSKLYGDKGNQHDSFNHRTLAYHMEQRYSEGARWLITYNDTTRIRNLYANSAYHLEPETWKYGMSTEKDGAELFISNY